MNVQTVSAHHQFPGIDGLTASRPEHIAAKPAAPRGAVGDVIGSGANTGNPLRRPMRKSPADVEFVSALPAIRKPRTEGARTGHRAESHHSLGIKIESGVETGKSLMRIYAETGKSLRHPSQKSGTEGASIGHRAEARQSSGTKLPKRSTLVNSSDVTGGSRAAGPMPPTTQHEVSRNAPALPGRLVGSSEAGERSRGHVGG